MRDENGIPEGFGGTAWADQTVLHPLGVAAIAMLGLAVLILPRRYAVLPMLTMACFVAPAQRIVVFSLDFNLLRIMVLFGWLRLVLHGEMRSMAWKTLDTAVLLWAASGVVAYSILHGSIEAAVFKCGCTFDALGMYLLFRCLIRSWDDLDRLVLGCVLLSIPVAAAFLVEKATGRNAFAMFGGVPEVTVMREGRLRCQGAFAHPILAGCFWAVLLPLIASLWWSLTPKKYYTCAGLACSLFIVIACSSSTPLVSLMMAGTAAILYPLRGQMRLVRWSAIICLCCLHLVMKAPVWHLISRTDIVGGSTGWHRYYLIDQAVHRFDEWWLLGTSSTVHWGHGLFDITNQFILEGVRGGALTLGLFIWIIALGFGAVGRLWRCMSSDPARTRMAWALGISLLVHCTNFFAVSYFGQIIMLWWLSIAIIASLDKSRSKAGFARPGAQLRTMRCSPFNQQGKCPGIIRPSVRSW